jgi:hypothetical protein
MLGLNSIAELDIFESSVSERLIERKLSQEFRFNGQIAGKKMLPVWMDAAEQISVGKL